MIDYHCHILPKMDDGPDRLSESLEMLRQSYQQGVEAMVSTCHFYADEDYPAQFVERRNAAFLRLREAMLRDAEAYPLIVLGAEVLYFPGISQAQDIEMLTIGSGSTILVEPPMTTWSDAMLDEIVELGDNLHCKPVIAHVDRFMRMLKNERLIDRVLEREMLVQVNAEYFIDPKTVKAAVRNLKKGKIHLIGSDCHNLTTRCPNLRQARQQARAFGAESEFNELRRNAVKLLFPRGNQ